MESKLQANIIRYLKSKGGFILTINGATLKGIPDILCLFNGKLLAIEVKLPNKKPTKLQLSMIDKLNQAGAIAYVENDLQFNKTKEIVESLM